MPRPIRLPRNLAPHQVLSVKTHDFPPLLLMVKISARFTGGGVLARVQRKRWLYLALIDVGIIDFHEHIRPSQGNKTILFIQP